mgnify:CR=1 FL=1
MFFSQNVGINSTGATPNASAVLDLNTGNTAANQGLLIPNVALTGTASAAPVTSPAASLMVYNTATVSDVTPGYYYWSGTAWVRLATAGSSVTSVTATAPVYSSGGTTPNISLGGTTNGVVYATGANSAAVKIGRAHV